MLKQKSAIILYGHRLTFTTQSSLCSHRLFINVKLQKRLGVKTGKHFLRNGDRCGMSQQRGHGLFVLENAVTTLSAPFFNVG